MSDAVLVLDGIERSFDQGTSHIEVLKGTSLALAAGEVVGLLGPSGSGKSTLLQIAGLLEPAEAGEVWIRGRSTKMMTEGERTETRRQALGFVYQFHYLLPEFSALENVVLPQMIAGRARAEAMRRAREILAALGLEARLDHRPAQLSGGEQQRVAIARAVINEPAVLLADEPTGNLDPKTAERVFDELLALVRTRKLAALVATHNPELAGRMDRTVELVNGRIRSLSAREVTAC